MFNDKEIERIKIIIELLKVGCSLSIQFRKIWEEQLREIKRLKKRGDKSPPKK